MNNKICMGIWGNTNLPDRFNDKGAQQMRTSGACGPEMAALINECTRNCGPARERA